MGHAREFDVDRFRTRLAEVVAWHALLGPLGDHAPAWWSVLRPEAPQVGRPPLQLRESLRRVRTVRARQLRPDAVAAARSRLEDAGGLLVVYVPDDSLFDGAAVAPSASWFDANNQPPDGAWVDVYAGGDGWVRPRSGWTPGNARAAILAWAPPALAAGVRLGVHINPEGCISLLGDGVHAGFPGIRDAVEVAPRVMCATRGWQDDYRGR